MEKLHKEYNYFVVFATKTNQLCSAADSLNILQIESTIMELAEIIITKPFAIDSIRIKCAELIGILFHFCHVIKTISPAKPSMYMKRIVLDEQEAVTRLLNLGRNLAYKYANTKILGSSKELWTNIEQIMHDLSEILWNIASMIDIHELLSFKIQISCNQHIVMEKMHAILSKPHMEKEFESKSIFPWNYYWHPGSKHLLAYIGDCSKTPLGIAFSLHDIVDHFYSQMMHKIYDHEEQETEILAEIGSLFQLDQGDFCLRDKRSLQWPLLQHIYTLKFEDIWNEKYLEIPLKSKITGELSEIIKSVRPIAYSHPILKKPVIQQHKSNNEVDHRDDSAGRCTTGFESNRTTERIESNTKQLGPTKWNDFGRLYSPSTFIEQRQSNTEKSTTRDTSPISNVSI